MSCSALIMHGATGMGVTGSLPTHWERWSGFNRQPTLPNCRNPPIFPCGLPVTPDRQPTDQRKPLWP